MRAVLFLGEVVLGVLRQIAQRGRLADAFLDVELRLVELFALLLELGLFRGADDLHDDPFPKRRPRVAAPVSRT